MFSQLNASLRPAVLKALTKLPTRSLSLPAAANTLIRDHQQLKDKVDAWTRPHTPGPLTAEELAHFFTHGYVIKHKLFDEQELDAPVTAINELVEQKANELFAAGIIKNTHSDKGFSNRLTALEQEFEHMSTLLHLHGELPHGVRELWSNPKLLDCAQQVLGNTFMAHPVWNLRTKTPQQEEATVPWHQDIGYLDESCWSTLQLTAWIPMVDANYENGCMQLVRGGHRTGRAAHHTCCVGGTWYIEVADTDMRNTLECDLEHDIVTCEVPKGSVLFLNNLIPHRSLNNMSDHIRWSFDLRFQRPDEPVGFYGIKEGLPLRVDGARDYPIDWEQWAEQSRQTVQRDTLGSKAEEHVHEWEHAQSTELPPQFDTRVVGPWMNRWPLVNHNRHTAALASERTITKA